MSPLEKIYWIFSFRILCFSSFRDERRQFIIKKYVDRKFSVPSQSDEPDGGELDLDLTFDSSTEDELLKDEVVSSA